MTVIYVDLLFMLNFVANYLLLLGTGRIAGCPLNRLRIALGSGAGAVYAVAVFLPGCGWLAMWPCKVVSGILMVLVAYGKSKRTVRVTLLFFAASASLAGMVLGAELLGSTGLTVRSGVYYSTVDIRLLLLLFILCYFLLSLVFRRMGRHIARDLLPLEISFSGSVIRMTALMDTGHTLTDPATNRTVVVADGSAFANILPCEVMSADPIDAVKQCHSMGIKGARLIPYRAVGVSCGMLLALRADRVVINGEDAGPLLVALSPGPVDDGGGYQALIGGDTQ